MNPEVEQLKKEVENLRQILESLNASATIPFKVHKAFENRFQILRFPVLAQSVKTALESAPYATISDPAGGATIDSQARTAINTLIDRLQSLGLIS